MDIKKLFKETKAKYHKTYDEVDKVMREILEEPGSSLAQAYPEGPKHPLWSEEVKAQQEIVEMSGIQAFMNKINEEIIKYPDLDVNKLPDNFEEFASYSMLKMHLGYLVYFNDFDSFDDLENVLDGLEAAIGDLRDLYNKYNREDDQDEERS